MSTYVPIQAITLSSAAASVQFTGIPQTYTDLVMVCQNGNTSGSRADIGFRFNGDSGSNYSRTNVFGTGTTAGSGRFSNETAMNLLGFPASGETNTTISYIMNYSNTTTNKTVLNRLNNLGYEVMASAGLWRNTAAITSIEVRIASNTMPSGSTFTLYGVGTGTPKAMGGTTVVTDGTYWYHAFQASGVFEPLQNLTADVLVIAGGGGGSLGGGGAGGLRFSAAQSLSAQSYSVSVGSGGGGRNSVFAPVAGVNGSNSSFQSITATGGGGGGAMVDTADRNGKNGGSGGGGGVTTGTGSGAAGTGVSGEGNNGGTGTHISGSYLNSGGGGGAGAVGGNGTAGGAGAGGVGVSTYSSWGSATLTGQNVSGTYWYAGGGTSLATASNGGGGAWPGQSQLINATDGIAGTGGGGGGGYFATNSTNRGGNGGSGIVIIRYAV